MKKKYIFSFMIVAIVAAFVVIGPSSVWSSVQQVYNKWMILTMILDKIQRFYVEDRDPDLLLQDAIDGMLSGLDPHSVFIPAEQAKDYSKKYHGYFGIGLNYGIFEKKYIVTSLVYNAPAASAGIRLGDRIQKIDGRSIPEMSPEQIEQILRGSTGSLVELDVIRPPQNEPHHFSVPKRRIELPSVTAACLLNSTTGYIQISHFSDATPQELDRAFDGLIRLGMQQLLLDLRNNAGGALEAGVAVADRLIPPGKIIVFTRGRAPQSSEQFVSSHAKTWPNRPLIILVNERTASDAEIIAGAVQDWDRGIIVGRRTFGKAMVQTEYPFQDGSRLLLTTARYYTPLGRLIQSSGDQQNHEKVFHTPKGRVLYDGGGIRPDYELKKGVPSTPAVFRKLYAEGENYFYQFADEYVIAQENSALPASLNEFLSSFIVSEDMLRRFADWSVGRQNKITRAEIEQNRAEIIAELKIVMAWRQWGEEGRNAASAFLDKEVQKSLAFFPDAAEIIVN